MQLEMVGYLFGLGVWVGLLIASIAGFIYATEHRALFAGIVFFCSVAEILTTLDGMMPEMQGLIGFVGLIAGILYAYHLRRSWLAMRAQTQPTE